MSAPSVLVVGAGVTGLAAAHALVGRGFDVTVLDRGPIPNPIASSFDRHRLIRHHYPDIPLYARRVDEAFAAWDDLWDELGETHYIETGVIAVSLEPGDWTDRARRAMDEVGSAYEMLDAAAFAARFPHFAMPDMAYCLLTRRGGALLADRILAGYIRLLREEGATLVPNAWAEAVDPAKGRVVARDGRVFEADQVLLAPGVYAPHFFQCFVDVTLEPRRSVLLYAEPPARWAGHWSNSPAWVDLGSKDEIWGIPPLPGIPMKLGVGNAAPEGDPSGPRFFHEHEVRGILDVYRTRVRDIDDFKVVEGHCNWWTMAPQERFVFRNVERAWFLSACSGHGFKFGALTGRDVAAAISGDEPAQTVQERLAGFDRLPDAA